MVAEVSMVCKALFSDHLWPIVSSFKDGMMGHDGQQIGLKMTQSRSSRQVFSRQQLLNYQNWLLAGPPLWKNMKVNWDDDINPINGQNNTWQPNHQPEKVMRLKHLFQDKIPSE